ncbi:MAG: HAD hydrolase family protein [Cytophagales bacterium]
MRIIVDLDGTICPIKQSGQTYADLKPLPGAIDKLRELKEKGHYIIIQTARNMATCDSNLGKVMKNVGLITLEWLKNYEVPYDEIFFGKPNGDIYIDDRAFRFENWEQTDEKTLLSLAKEK